MENKNINSRHILPMILLILDGWGIDKPNKGNAVTLSKTPIIDGLIKNYPNTLICASGHCVGLLDKQAGNSEAGHQNMGAGRIVDQDVVIINKSIKNGSFFKNPAFLEAIRNVKNHNSKLHIMGLLSNGMSPHSDPEHIYALIKLARNQNIKSICLHLFTDGRDSPKYSSLKLIEELKSKLNGNEKICTIVGRYYAMDRKKKWDNTEKSYNAIVSGKGIVKDTPDEAITEAYNKGESDEFIQPYIIGKDNKNTRINDNDSIIFFNLRSDRSRQLAKVFVQENFNKMNPGSFKRIKVLKKVHFVAMTDFGPDLGNILSAFPSIDINNTLPMKLNNLKQLYIAEKEKYAHVTYFFNGGYGKKVDDEEYFMVPSPDVKSYDQVPAMSTLDLTQKVIENLKNNKYDFTVLNFAAPDMIGHTGNLKAAIQCCEAVDSYLGQIIKSYLKKNGTILVTADHGNIEKMINLETDEVFTEHTTNPVPFILVNNKLKDKIKLKSDKNIIGDIAPTILDLLEIDKPKLMSGKSLIDIKMIKR